MYCTRTATPTQCLLPSPRHHPPPHPAGAHAHRVGTEGGPGSCLRPRTAETGGQDELGRQLASGFTSLGSEGEAQGRGSTQEGYAWGAGWKILHLV